MNNLFLEWDSLFFKKKIYQLNIENDFSEKDKEFLSTTNADLVYIIADNMNERVDYVCRESGAKLVDQKVTYEKTLSPIPINQLSRLKYESIYQLTPGLESMVYLSGKFSRFQSDEHLQPFFRPLYLEWIQKSLTREIADDVIIAYDSSGTEVGFFTISNKNNIGNIGLIAVHESYQGKGIGRDLLLKAEEWFIARGINKYNVVTQVNNIPACKLYEKNSCKVESLKYIYHLWKNN
jgi:dTDP-4-amino-4,6-dideoxy-D-galactose acyltransferase